MLSQLKAATLAQQKKDDQQTAATAKYAQDHQAIIAENEANQQRKAAESATVSASQKENRGLLQWIRNLCMGTQHDDDVQQTRTLLLAYSIVGIFLSVIVYVVFFTKPR
jgi:high-affinity Fe2+/Pb2+ permease